MHELAAQSQEQEAATRHPECEEERQLALQWWLSAVVHELQLELRHGEHQEGQSTAWQDEEQSEKVLQEDDLRNYPKEQEQPVQRVGDLVV
jgi:nitric oxide synthase oxygenase domain/subunit